MVEEVIGPREEPVTIDFLVCYQNCLLTNYDLTHRAGKFTALDIEASFCSKQWLLCSEY